MVRPETPALSGYQQWFGNVFDSTYPMITMLFFVMLVLIVDLDLYSQGLGYGKKEEQGKVKLQKQ